MKEQKENIFRSGSGIDLRTNEEPLLKFADLKNNRFACVILALFLALSLTVSVCAETQTYNPTTTNALNVIRNTLELKKTALVNTEITFTPEEFEQLLGIKKLTNITIKSLPDVSCGVMIAGNQDISADQTISREGIRQIRIIPYPDRLGRIEFTFNSSDANSGDLDIKCSVSVLDSLNFAPSASSFSITTQKNIAAVKSMQAIEPDSDTVRYSITSSPKKGTLEILDVENGNFIYHPNKNYTGKDSFSYVAVDEYGNVSNTAIATIKVVKPAANVYFTDLKNHWAHNSAIKAVAVGFIEADNTQNALMFYPDALVSRAEFVKMTVIAAGQGKKLETVYNTGFSDDADIPKELKAYVKRAYELGYIKGTLTETGLYFNPNNAITRAEAAVIINKIAAIPTANMTNATTNLISSLATFKDAVSVPAWAADDISALYANGIIKGTGDGNINANGFVNKAQAVELLCNLRTYTDSKKSGFLSFLFK